MYPARATQGSAIGSDRALGSPEQSSALNQWIRCSPAWQGAQYWGQLKMCESAAEAVGVAEQCTQTHQAPGFKQSLARLNKLLQHAMSIPARARNPKCNIANQKRCESLLPAAVKTISLWLSMQFRQLLRVLDLAVLVDDNTDGYLRLAAIDLRPGNAKSCTHLFKRKHEPDMLYSFSSPSPEYCTSTRSSGPALCILHAENREHECSLDEGNSVRVV